MKRLKELREQIEKRNQEKTVEQIYNDVLHLLQGIFGKKTEQVLVDSFKKEFIDKGKLPENYLTILKDTVKAHEMFKKGKLARHEIEDARKNASQLISHLIEYNQRCELVSLQKGKFRIKAKDKIYELVLTGSEAFLISQGKVERVTSKIQNSSVEELTNATAKNKSSEIKIDTKVFDILKKHIGSFEIIL